MTRRETYKRTLIRDVARQAITASAATVLLYQYDHPGTTLRDAAAACGVPYVCVAHAAPAELT